MTPIIVVLALTSLVVAVIFPLVLKFLLKTILNKNVSYFACFLLVLASSAVVNAVLVYLRGSGS